MKHLLIERKIVPFKTQDAEPRFEIKGVAFTTDDLIRLHHEKKLTNIGISEIIGKKTKMSTII